MTKQPVCAVCGKPAQRHELNRDGTYLHIQCSAQIAHQWTQPTKQRLNRSA